MRRTARGSHAGFTLIELMIVMVIIIILAGMAVVMYSNSVTRSKEAVLRTDLFRMRDAIDQYYADKNKYPASLQALVSEKYLRSVPVDPFTNSTDTWQTTMSEPDPTSTSTDVGVFDVKSGTEATAIDGTRYADW